MPLLDTSTYRPPRWLDNGQLLTIYPTLFRNVTGVVYARERIDTPDGDFLDLDFSRIGSDRIAVLSHGLEGDSNRGYMLGMARALNRAGWDVLAWNYRGCSGSVNLRPRFYHSGATDDLDTVVRHVLADDHYCSVALVGFSLGGNMTLKYLGERGDDLPERVHVAAAFSVPCDLESSAERLARPSNRIYMRRFLRSLERKVTLKRLVMPDALPDADFRTIKTFRDFDGLYTAPLHGFRDAEDYWHRCSSRGYLQGIRIPTLLVNAKDDPFLGAECFPVEEARTHPYLHFEIPDSGGHVGFVRFNRDGEYWLERRAVEFLRSMISVDGGKSLLWRSVLSPENNQRTEGVASRRP